MTPYGQLRILSKCHFYWLIAVALAICLQKVSPLAHLQLASALALDNSPQQLNKLPQTWIQFFSLLPGISQIGIAYGTSDYAHHFPLCTIY